MRWLAALRPEPFLILMTAAWIVGLFAASSAPLLDLWRPLLVGIAIAYVATVLPVLVRPSAGWAQIAVGVLWLLVLGAWPLAFVIVFIGVWRVLVDRLRRMQRRQPMKEPASRQVLRVANVLGVAAVLVGGVNLASSGAIGVSSSGREEAALTGDPAGPSLYLVLLDGYPATDVLSTSFGYDNSGFEEALTRRGFQLPQRPTSNYNRTLLTLASMLHLRHVDEIPGLAEPREGFAAQTRQVTSALNAAPLLRDLERAGYETTFIRSTYGEAAITSADRLESSGALTLFEEQLIRYSAAGRWLIEARPELVADQHRAGVDDVLDAIASAPSRVREPAFVLAHVFSPHPPFVFAADGSERPLPGCYPHRCGMTTPARDLIDLSPAEYREGLVSQIEYLNGRLLDVADALIAGDPDAVILFFSDHGARFEVGPQDEHFEVFAAARTPGRNEVLADGISLVNVMPSIVNAYFGTDLPLAPDTRSWAPDVAPLELEPVE